MEGLEIIGGVDEQWLHVPFVCHSPFKRLIAKCKVYRGPTYKDRELLADLLSIKEAEMF